MQPNEPRALSSEEKVRELALLFIRITEAIHHTLKKHSASDPSLAAGAYALLTEEYALRSRAQTLLIEPGRFVHVGLNTTQQEMLGALEGIYAKLINACTLDEISEIVISVVLFANSTASRKSGVITFLLDDLMRIPTIDH